MRGAANGKKPGITSILGVAAGAAFALGVAVSLAQYGSFGRVWHDIVVRPSGPFGLRFFLQPLVAAAIAFIDGVRDAKAGQSRNFWALHHDGQTRWELFAEALRAVANVLFLAVILDTTYQLVITRTFYPFETILVAVLLAVLPYLLVRGPAAWLAGHFVRPADSHSAR